MKTKKIHKKTVAVVTLGCKVNQYETASMENGFTAKGFEIIDFSDKADIYVINTCAVTAKAAAQSRQLIRRAQRTNPDARVVVTGCYAQIDPAAVMEAAAGRIIVFDNVHKHLLVDNILKEGQRKIRFLGDIGKIKKIDFFPVHRFAGRTRAFLKIQDGCNNFCSYCIVPFARGRSRSQQPAEVMRQAKKFAVQGYKELVVTGIHVGAYGRDLEPPVNILGILEKLTSLTPAIRYRISSLEPTEITDELIDFMAETENLMPHLHIPLQSGDNRILKKMNRRYAAADFENIVAKTLRFLPDIAIGVDVLVGFPGEDAEAFGNTVQLLQDLPVAYLHVFPYSKRPGTRAAAMPGQVAKNIKEERVAFLRELGRQKRRAFHEKHLGGEFRVLAESRQGGLHIVKGFTENYIPVLFTGTADDENRIISVKIERVEQDGSVRGKIIEK